MGDHNGRVTEERGGEVVIVGGGLAGLTAALVLARAGRAVTLFERAGAVGGRATTHIHDGFSFNQGPHALYLGGPGAAALRRLGIAFTGGQPPLAGLGVRDGRLHPLPASASSLLTTGLLGPRAKLELARFLAGLGRLDPGPLVRLPLGDWLDRAFRRLETRQILAVLARVTTYTDAPDLLSAGAFIAQLRISLQPGVCYLDGGWQTLVDGLSAAAQAAGARIVTGARVAAVEHDGAARGVRLADGALRPAGAVVLATGPAAARALVAGGDDTPLDRWAEGATPVRAACLDLALRRLPRPRRPLAFGIDRPLYLSVHSAVARLAPAGGATVHVAKYLHPAAPADPHADKRELEGLLDLVQPGWRDEIVARRFLPKLVVTNTLVAAARGGLAGRPGPAVPGIDNLYVAGDWVGPAGMLADASLASAQQAAELILRDGGAKVEGRGANVAPFAGQAAD